MGTTLSLHGRVVNKNGSALSGKTVKLYDVTNPSSPVEIPSAATVTDANGYFAITNQDDTKPYRVVVEYNPTSNLVAVRERFSAQMRNLQVWDRLHVRSGAVVSIETDATVNRTLTVGGTTSGGQAKVYVYDTNQVVIYTEQATNNNTSVSLSFNKARGTIPTRSAVVSGDDIFTISGTGWDGNAYREAVQIKATVDGTPGANDMPGKLAVLTSPDGSANPVERFSVKNNGEVIANRSLTVGGTTAGGQAKVYVYDTDQVTLYMEQVTGGNTSVNLSFNKARGTLAARALVSSGDQLFTISGSGWDGSAYREAVKVVATVDGTPGANDMPGKLAVLTSPDGSATAVERFSVKNNGEVIANRSLTVGGTTAGGQAKVYVYDSDQVTLYMEQATNSNTATNLSFNKARGTITARSAVASGDDIFAISGSGWDGAAYREAVKIVATVDGAPGANDMPGKLAVLTSPDGSANPVERFSVKNNGEVIANRSLTVGGTTTGGQAKVYVYDTDQVTLYIEQANTGTSSPNLSFNKARGSIPGRATVASGDEVFVISGSGWDGSGYQSSAAIYAIVDGNVSSGNVPGRVEIRTKTSGQAGLRTQMRINEESVGFRQILAASSVSSLSGVLRIRNLANGDVVGYIPVYNNYA